MISQPRFVALFSKTLFVVLLACMSVMLGDRFAQIRANGFLCCVFNPTDLNRADQLMVNMPILFLFSLLAVGLLAAIWKVIRTRHEVNKLLVHAKKGLPASVKRMVSDLNIVEEILVVDMPQPFACVFGFFRPRICLSRGAIEQLAPEELKATVLHEIRHCREFDPLRLLLINAISISLFFLPVVREWGRNYEIDTELSADRFAIQHAGKPALAGAIHHFATFSPSSRERASTAIFSGFTGNAVRVAELLGGEGPRRQISTRSLVVSGLSVILICTFLLG